MSGNLKALELVHKLSSICEVVDKKMAKKRRRQKRA